MAVRETPSHSLQNPNATSLCTALRSERGNLAPNYDASAYRKNFRQNRTGCWRGTTATQTAHTTAHPGTGVRVIKEGSSSPKNRRRSAATVTGQPANGRKVDSNRQHPNSWLNAR